MVAVTCIFLNKWIFFRESSFVLTQAHYRKLQRTVKRKWNKRIYLIWNLQIPIHFLLSLVVSHHSLCRLWSHENEMLVLWLAVNNMRPQQKLLSLYVEKYFRIKKRRRQKLKILLQNQVLFSFEMRKYASFVEMNMILMTKSTSTVVNSWNMRYPSSKYCNFYLLKNFAFILQNQQILPVLCDFLIPMTTETTHNLCSFQIKCSIQILTLMLT